jgi:hypothetical protein
MKAAAQAQDAQRTAHMDKYNLDLDGHLTLTIL